MRSPHRALHSLRAAAGVCLLCWLVSVPCVLYHHGILSPLAPLWALVLGPVVACVLAAGYLTLVAGVLVPALAGPASAVADTLAGGLSRLVLLADALPFAAVQLPRVSALWAVVATLAIVWFIARPHARRLAPRTALLGAIAWLAVELALGTSLPSRVGVRVDAVAVGDGSCLLVRSGRSAILWDCGSLRPGVGAITVPRTLRALGAWRVDTVVITHPHIDHFNALPEVAGVLGVRRVLTSEATISRAENEPWGAARALLDRLEELGVEVVVVHAGDTVDLGGATLEFLWPPRGLGPLGPGASVHDLSLAARVVTPGGGLLLTGDIEARAMRGMAIEERVRVVELPHHGSYHDEAARFVMRLDPGVVLQSTGPSRAGDARWAPVRDGRRWHVTATDGAAWAEILRDGRVRSGSVR